MIVERKSRWIRWKWWCFPNISQNFHLWAMFSLVQCSWQAPFFGGGFCFLISWSSFEKRQTAITWQGGSTLDQGSRRDDHKQIHLQNSSHPFVGQSFWGTAKCLMKVKQNPPWWHIIVGKLDPFCLKPSCPEKSIGNAASSNACWTWRKCPIWSDWPVALRIGKLVEPHHLGNIINSKCVQIPSKESSGRKTRGFWILDGFWWLQTSHSMHILQLINIVVVDGTSFSSIFTVAGHPKAGGWGREGYKAAGVTVLKNTPGCLGAWTYCQFSSPLGTSIGWSSEISASFAKSSPSLRGKMDVWDLRRSHEMVGFPWQLNN